VNRSPGCGLPPRIGWAAAFRTIRRVPSVPGMRTATASPLDRLLTLSVPVSFALTLVSSVLYAVRGWDDPIAALLHVLGGAVGGVAIVRLATILGAGWLPAIVLLLGELGCAGVIGYGFNTMAVGLGGVDLIDATGVAAVLKVLGLFWPLALLLVGVGLLRAGRALLPYGIGTAVAAVAFPVSRIVNIGWLAVVVDVVLLACLVAPAVARRGAGTRADELATAR